MKARSLIIILVVFFLASGAASYGQNRVRSLDRDKYKTASQPIEVTFEVEGKAFPETGTMVAGPEWLENLRIKVTNVGTKPIISFHIELVIPKQAPMASAYTMIISYPNTARPLKDPAKAERSYSAPKIPLMSGESITTTIPEQQLRVLDSLRTLGIKEIDGVAVDVRYVYFEDGSRWMLGRMYSQNNKPGSNWTQRGQPPGDIVGRWKSEIDNVFRSGEIQEFSPLLFDSELSLEQNCRWWQGVTNLISCGCGDPAEVCKYPQDLVYGETGPPPDPENYTKGHMEDRIGWYCEPDFYEFPNAPGDACNLTHGCQQMTIQRFVAGGPGCEPENYCEYAYGPGWFYWPGTRTCVPPECQNCVNNGGTHCTETGDCWTPVIFDLLGDGVRLTSVSEGIMYRLRPGTPAIQTAWTETLADDAWLVLDRNQNGQIDDATELFSCTSPQPDPPTGGIRNGFAALAQYDKPEYGGNSDGTVDRADGVFSELRLWQDSNHNGSADSGELWTLADFHTTVIDLALKESMRRDRHGNVFRYRVFVDGTRARWAWDVFLQAKNPAN
jgi:hypothetical protein